MINVESINEGDLFEVIGKCRSASLRVKRGCGKIFKCIDVDTNNCRVHLESVKDGFKRWVCLEHDDYFEIKRA